MRVYKDSPACKNTIVITLGGKNYDCISFDIKTYLRSTHLGDMHRWLTKYWKYKYVTMKELEIYI